jgi:hypothetical protein
MEQLVTSLKQLGIPLWVYGMVSGALVGACTTLVCIMYYDWKEGKQKDEDK